MSNKKKERRKFDLVASTLPKFLDNTIEKHRYTGLELKEMGYVTKPGEVLIDHLRYTYNYPVQMQMNLSRRIRRAYQSGGYEAVNAFINSLAKTITFNQEKEETI